MWPQYVFILYLILQIGIAFKKHGEPKGKYNVFEELRLAVAMAVLLYFGGFFKGMF